MSRSGEKGTKWETRVVEHLKANGVPHAERRAKNGERDRGDISGVPGLVIEAKNAARTELGAWVDEAEAERANDGAALGVVWHHRRGRSSPGAGYVTMTGDTFLALLRAAGYLAPKEGLMADRCDVTELLADQCAHCRKLPDPPTGERGPWFRAAYPGRCSECNTWFLPGNDIRADGHGGYLGDCCGADDA